MSANDREAPVFEVRRNRSEIDIPADIRKSQKVIAECEKDIVDITHSVVHLHKRREHFKKLISEGSKYNPKSLQASIDSLEVEARKMHDIITNQQDRIEHHRWIITELEKRLNEAPLKLEFISGPVC